MNNTTGHAPAPSALKVLATLLSVLAISTAATDASANWKQPSGDFVSFAVPPPVCDSPIGICTSGTLEGDLDSSYYFVMDTLVWAGDLANPTKLLYTGHSIITDAQGHQMFGADTGVMFENPNPTEPSPFETTVNVIGGTGKYKKRGGQIVATGGLTFASGLASGTYTGSLCKDDN